MVPSCPAVDGGVVVVAFAAGVADEASLGTSSLSRRLMKRPSRKSSRPYFSGTGDAADFFADVLAPRPIERPPILQRTHEHQQEHPGRRHLPDEAAPPDVVAVGRAVVGHLVAPGGPVAGRHPGRGVGSLEEVLPEIRAGLAGLLEEGRGVRARLRVRGADATRRIMCEKSSTNNWRGRSSSCSWSAPPPRLSEPDDGGVPHPADDPWRGGQIGSSTYEHRGDLRCQVQVRWSAARTFVQHGGGRVLLRGANE